MVIDSFYFVYCVYNLDSVLIMYKLKLACCVMQKIVSLLIKRLGLARCRKLTNDIHPVLYILKTRGP